MNPKVLDKHILFPFFPHGTFCTKDLLNKLKAPFFLRRQKTDPKIAADLPEKQEQTHICELSNKQRTGGERHGRAFAS